MAQAARPTIHASCVLVGARAVLIRGASGSGKSQLAAALLRAAERGEVSFVRLVADDRTLIETIHGCLLARPAPELAGLIEVRGIGIEKVPHEPLAAVGLVVDLGEAGERLPTVAAQTVTIEGVALPRLAVPPGADALAMVLAALRGPTMARERTEFHEK